MNLCKLLAVGALAIAAGAANATFTINITQNGPNVVMTGSGSIDTTGSASAAVVGLCGTNTGSVGPTNVCVGSGGTGATYAASLVPPLSGFTTGAATSATSATGTPVFVATDTLGLPAGYVSGSAISSTSTFAGRTLASLGLTPGATRTLTLASGDTIQIVVGPVPANPASIPTLSEYALLVLASLVGMLGISAARRKSGGTVSRSGS